MIHGRLKRSTCSVGRTASLFLALFLQWLLGSVYGKQFGEVGCNTTVSVPITNAQTPLMDRAVSHGKLSCSADPGWMFWLTEAWQPEFFQPVVGAGKFMINFASKINRYSSANNRGFWLLSLINALATDIKVTRSVCSKIVIPKYDWLLTFMSVSCVRNRISAPKAKISCCHYKKDLI